MRFSKFYARARGRLIEGQARSDRKSVCLGTGIRTPSPGGVEEGLAGVVVGCQAQDGFGMFESFLVAIEF